MSLENSVRKMVQEGYSLKEIKARTKKQCGWSIEMMLLVSHWYNDEKKRVVYAVQ